MVLVHAQEGAPGVELREVPLLPQLRRSARRLASAAAARAIRIETRDLPDLIAYVDPRLLARVLDNVLANAVFYNRDGGRIEISGASADRSGAGALEMVTISVSDTGTGIPPDESERVFDRFYRLDQSRAPGSGGSGLGLAICREVLAVLRGSIRIATSSREGTTVQIMLPGRVASSGKFTEQLGDPTAYRDDGYNAARVVMAP
jgi:two-component system phosphate regulon sensor histidine kinase PhoR